MDINASGMSRRALSSNVALMDAVRCRSRSWAARTFGAAPHYASRNDEASIRAVRRDAPFQQPVIVRNL